MAKNQRRAANTMNRRMRKALKVREKRLLIERTKNRLLGKTEESDLSRLLQMLQLNLAIDQEMESYLGFRHLAHLAAEEIYKKRP